MGTDPSADPGAKTEWGGKTDEAGKLVAKAASTCMKLRQDRKEG